MQNNPKYIIVHCTAVSYKKVPVQFFAVNRYHQGRMFPRSTLGWNLGYHFFYEKSGQELRGREDWEVGAHCNDVVDELSMNFQSIGLCWAGDGDIEMPTPNQTEKLRMRIEKLCKKYDISKDKVLYIAPHRLWNDRKTCYGTLLPDDWAWRLVNPKEKLEYEKEAEKAIVSKQRKVVDNLEQLILIIKIKINILLVMLKINKLLGIQGRMKKPL